MERNVLILGAGLAGLCMGVQLYRRGIPFRIRHAPGLPCASEKAAGLMNPVVVKRLLKTWMADEVLPYNRLFYPETERLTGTSFYSPVALHRLFSNAEVASEWTRRVADGDMDEFLSPDVYRYAPDILGTEGMPGADILQATRVDTGTFIRGLRDFFSGKGHLHTGSLAYADIRFTENGFSVDGEAFSQIVFCEGMGLPNNPWFGRLPLVPTKGELLYLEIPGLPAEKELLRGAFLAPLMQGGFVCGSTYEWRFADDEPSESAKENLLAELTQWMPLPYRVTDHTAGIRPASRDRRPFLGEHPVHKGLFVFNGLGTKGYMLAPYLSARLAELLCDGKPLPRETDIARVKVNLE